LKRWAIVGAAAKRETLHEVMTFATKCRRAQRFYRPFRDLSYITAHLPSVKTLCYCRVAVRQETFDRVMTSTTKCAMHNKIHVPGGDS
jgi:hypothetical protein